MAASVPTVAIKGRKEMMVMYDKLQEPKEVFSWSSERKMKGVDGEEWLKHTITDCGRISQRSATEKNNQ